MLIGVVILLLVKKNLGAFFKLSDFNIYLQESENLRDPASLQG